jgi:hypothetical protein
MRPTLAALAALVALPFAARAQAPRPMPGFIVAQVGLPDATPARFANVTVTLQALPWTMHGCVANVAGVCFATRRIDLTEADRRELVTRVQDVSARRRCEPEGFAQGDPAYTIAFPAAVYAGHLPARSADIAARSAGPCEAPARLAWWITQRFTR